jgi:hypothetical protein
MRRMLAIMMMVLWAAAAGAEAVSPAVWDFGEVREGATLTHVFILRNEGSARMRITGTHSSCGCTVPRIGKSSLAAGEETEIEVKFESAGYRGPVSQFVYVNTDNAENPVLKYVIKADVK